MRRDKTAARIFLILSAVHIAVAAPATVRLRSLDIIKNVTPALEKRGDPDESSHPFPQTGNDLAATSGTAPSQDDVQPSSGTPSQDNLLPESGALQLHDGSTPTLGVPPAPDDTPPGSGTPQLHHDPQPTSGTPPSPDDTPSGPGTSLSPDNRPPTSGTLQLHNDPQLAPGALLSPDDMPQESETRPAQDEEMLQGESSGVSQLHDDPLSQHTDSRLLGETLQEESPGMSESGESHLQVDLPPASGTSEEHGDSSWRWLYNFRANEGALSSSGYGPSDLGPPISGESEEPSSLEPSSPPPNWHFQAAPAAPPSPEAHTFFNDALKQKLKTFAKIGAVAGASAVITLGIQTLIKDHSHGSHQAYVSAFFPPSLADL